MENQPPPPGSAAQPAGAPLRGTRAPDETGIGIPRERTARPAETPDEEWSALGSTRIVDDDSSDIVGATPGQGSGPVSEIRRAVQGDKPTDTFGDFRIIKKIGEGAMGKVYKAHQLGFNRDVALKILFKHVAANAKLVERFYREARVAGKLDHPNIVRGYEVGERDGWHYFAMEYVPGKSLQRVLDALGKLTVGDALYIVIRAARGLRYAHEEGLVHRDVKPDNLLITRKGEVKLADLGMVKQLDEDLSLTQTGHAVGTPWYMPLEQAKNSKDADGRCDIYALGCVLYALLTGRPPFSGGTLVDVIQAKEIGTFPEARKSNPEVPGRLDIIIAKMTAKQVRHRYQTCAEVLKDLEGLNLAGEALGFLAPRSETPPAPKAEPSPPGETPLPPPLKRPADVWYVRYRSPEGQPVVRKLSTSQVLELLENESFDPLAKATRDPKDGFRALATFREFEGAALARVSKNIADRQAHRSLSQRGKIYKQIEEQDRQRAEAEREAAETTVTGYWLGIGWRVAAVVAVVGGAVYLVSRVISMLH